MFSSRIPVLRLSPARADLNSNGHIFGGWVLSQMDIAGGITAARRASGPVATVAITSMQFVRPILLGDVISVYTDAIRTGRTSITVAIEVTATRRGEEAEVTVTQGEYTFVAIDENGRPRPVDAEA